MQNNAQVFACLCMPINMNCCHKVEVAFADCQAGTGGILCAQGSRDGQGACDRWKGENVVLGLGEPCALCLVLVYVHCTGS